MLTKKFFEQLIKTTDLTIQEAINAIYEYQKVKSYIPKYYRYPEVFLKSIKEDESYKEMKASIPALNCGIEFYVNSSFKSPVDYSWLLSCHDGEYSINCNNFENFGELIQLLKSEPKATKVLVSEEKNIDIAIVRFVANITNRYLYISKKFKSGDYDAELAKTLIEQQYNRLFNEKLNVNICVPICFMTFETDETEITNNTSILKMDKAFQMGRYNATHFESKKKIM